MNRNHLTDSQISRIQELIDNDVGDSSRLQHIKEALENGNQLYDSDQNYLDSLISKYFGDDKFLNPEKEDEESETELKQNNEFVNLKTDTASDDQLKDLHDAQKKIDDLEKRTKYAEEQEYRKQYFKSEGTTLVFSVILGLFGILGVGHFYIGKIRKGAIFLISGLILMGAGVATITVGFGFVLILGYFILYIWSIIGSRDLCKQYNLHLQNVGKKPW